MTGRHHTGLAEACKKLTACTGGKNRASCRLKSGAVLQKNGRRTFFPIK
jgi:hypothetical protein